MEAFPLHWPDGYPRSNYKKRSAFRCTFSGAVKGITHEIRLMGGKNPIISTNIPIKKDGFPYSATTFRKPDDPGVAVYFTYENEQIVLACDKWTNIEENMQAICKALEAMRGIERWGVTDMLKRAFTGFKALPNGVTEYNNEPWFKVLHVSKTAPEEMVKTAYRHLVKKYHPDNLDTGDSKMFEKIQAAYDRFRENP